MGSKGVQKTTIDELAAAAGIAKGSFYRFFQSKEELALEILADWELKFHELIQSRFIEQTPQGAEAAARTLHGIMVEDFPRMIFQDGMQALLSPEEIRYLKLRSSDEHIALMDEQDIRLFARLKPLFRHAGLQSDFPDAVIIAALRLVFDSVQSLFQFNASGPLTIDDFHQGFLQMLTGTIERLFTRISGEDNEY
ncbi:hypothetical protein JCM12856_15650 [Spirochaeta dissipatitropha]